MLRALTLATFLVVLPGAASGQALAVLHVKVTLKNATRGVMPVPRHALLISDNPATSAPRRVVTGADGTVDVRLRPGNYTVESDEPIAFDGKGYHWTQTVDIAAGRDAVLELTAENAEVGAAPAASAPEENDPFLLLPQWQDSVVAVWTAQSRASGFLVDPAAGLVVTSQRGIGTASSVDVQLTPSVKVAARVLVSDRVRDVAVLWIDQAAAAPVRPVPLGCADAPKAPFANGQRFVALGAPLSGPKEVALGDVVGVEPHGAVGDFRLAPGSTGGPVFSSGGRLVGLSSAVDDEDERRRKARIVSLGEICEEVASAEKAMPAAPRPVAAHLPVEPLQPFPADAPDAAAKRGQVTAIQLSSSNFDVAFLTPLTAAKDLGDWTEYFADRPAVLAVRVTPKMAESFWTTVARGAALTQGVALPPIKHFKPGFARMRVLCGDVEVTPIHPFVLDRRVSETDAVREGLYVFAPDALGPHCKTVTLMLYSEKDPDKPDTRAIDPQTIERIWQDFAPHRALRNDGAAYRR